MPHDVAFCRVCGIFNPVGYHSLDWMKNNEFYMMGAQFDGVGGSYVKLSQINFGEGFDGPEYGYGPEEYQLLAPQIQLAFPNREGTLGYYFIHDAYKNDDGVYVPGWMGEDDNPADPDIILGLGFWFKDPFNNKCVFQNAGQVNGEPVFEKDFIRNEFMMLVPGYPRDMRLSEITFVDIDNNSPEYEGGPDDYQPLATQIQIPFANREGFSYYYFIHDAVPNDDGGYDPGWMGEDDNPVDPTEIVIPAGRGCWFRASKNFPKEKMTVVFPK